MNAFLRRAGAGAMALAMTGMVACDDDETVSPELPGNLVEVAQGAGSFQTLLIAAQEAGLAATLANDGPFTVFAPTDAAFDALPDGTLQSILDDTELLTRVLTYHVVSGQLDAAEVLSRNELTTLNGGTLAVSTAGGNAFVNESRIVQTDVFASNGVIHVIDEVLLPEPVQDIPGTAASAGIFNTLLAAVEAAGLLETLQGAGPFTVFAPTDDAFDALPEGTLDELLADPDALAEILLYHVVAGEVTAEQVMELSSAETVNGASVSISVVDGVVRIDDANVIATDVRATNGIIHVIDAVLIPEES